MTGFKDSFTISSESDVLAGFYAHKKQVPALKSINDNLSKMFSELASSVVDHANIKYTIQRVQYHYHLQRISELNCSLILCLREEQYTSVEALSRVSLESIVNFMYLLGERDNERASGFIKGYLKRNKYKAKEWLKHSSAVGDDEGVKHSSRLLEAMDNGLESLQNSKGGNPKMWPDKVKQKFLAVDMEGAYVTLFASSSDSVHHGAEDIYNRTIIESLNDKVKEEAVRYILAENASFAIYLAVCAIEYAAVLLHLFCNKIEEEGCLDGLRKLQEDLKSLHMEHENHHANSFM